MARTDIISSKYYVYQNTIAGGLIDYQLNVVDRIGQTWTRYNQTPTGTDMAALANDIAAEIATMLWQNEVGEWLNTYTFNAVTDAIVMPTDAGLNYADQGDLATALHQNYAPATGLLLLNFGAAVWQLPDARLTAEWFPTITDPTQLSAALTELKNRLSRQNTLRNALATETGE